MADKLMYIPNHDTQNSLFCRLQLLVETFGHSNSPMSPPSLAFNPCTKANVKKHLSQEMFVRLRQFKVIFKDFHLIYTMILFIYVNFY